MVVIYCFHTFGEAITDLDAVPLLYCRRGAFGQNDCQVYLELFTNIRFCAVQLDHILPF